MLATFKTDAGRAMKLGNDDTLSTIDDEGSAICHERDFTHIHSFLFGTGFFAKLEGDVERCTVGFSFADGFQRSELGVTDFVEYEIESHFLVVALDRKDLFEHGLEADVLALRGEDILLQEILIGPKLYLNQVRWLGDFVDLAKVGALGHKRGGEATRWRGAWGCGAGLHGTPKFEGQAASPNFEDFSVEIESPAFPLEVGCRDGRKESDDLSPPETPVPEERSSR
jgi:hypothetical protein